MLHAVYNKNINGINKNTYTDKLGNITFIIECDSSVITNVMLFVSDLRLCIKCRSIWKHVMEITEPALHDNHMQFIVQP